MLALGCGVNFTATPARKATLGMGMRDFRHVLSMSFAGVGVVGLASMGPPVDPDTKKHSVVLVRHSADDCTGELPRRT